MPLVPLLIAGVILAIISALMMMHPAGGTYINEKTFLSGLFDALQIIIPMTLIATILITALSFSKINTEFYFIFSPLIMVITGIIWDTYLAIGNAYFSFNNLMTDAFVVLVLSLISVGIYAGLKKLF